MPELEQRGRDFISSETLRKLGILPPNYRQISQTLIFDSGMRSESWIYGVQVDIYGPQGGKTVRVKEKNIISFAFGLREKAETQLARLRLFESLGIPIPHTWGIRGASIYQEFLPDDRTEEAIRTIAKGPYAESRELLDQLIEIAARVDISGFSPLGLLGDLMFDGQSGTFIYLDVGNDLLASRGPSTTCRTQLLKRFPQYAETILSSYAQMRVPLYQGS